MEQDGEYGRAVISIFTQSPYSLMETQQNSCGIT